MINLKFLFLQFNKDKYSINIVINSIIINNFLWILHKQAISIIMFHPEVKEQKFNKYKDTINLK